MVSQRVLCVGPVYLDVNCLRFPCESGMPVEEEILGADYRLAPGGSAANFARVGRSLGMETKLLGKIGNDGSGELLARMLEPTGVELSLVRDSTVSTGLGINFISPVGTSVMAIAGTAHSGLGLSELEQIVGDFVDRETTVPSGLYLGGCFKLPHLLRGFIELVRTVRKDGVTVILDHGRVPPGTDVETLTWMRRLVETVDIYLPSKAEFCTLWGVDEVEAGVRRLLDEGESERLTIAVKDGSLGASAFTREEQSTASAYDVTVGNTVGAGDSFNAGFVAAGQLPLARRLDYACAVAGLMVSGGDPPTPERVAGLMRESQETDRSG